MKAMRMSRLGQTMSQALNLPVAGQQPLVAPPPGTPIQQPGLFSGIGGWEDIWAFIVMARLPILIGAGVLVGGIVLYRGSRRKR